MFQYAMYIKYSQLKPPSDLPSPLLLHPARRKRRPNIPRLDIREHDLRIRVVLLQHGRVSGVGGTGAPNRARCGASGGNGAVEPGHAAGGVVPLFPARLAKIPQQKNKAVFKGTGLRDLRSRTPTPCHWQLPSKTAPCRLPWQTCSAGR